MTDDRISRTRARELVEAAPIMVLDRPQMGENIGAAARAMLNFGISAMRLVNPRDGWPNPKATAMASGAAMVIDDARIFNSMDEALVDCQYVLATTARRREMALPVLTPQEAAENLIERISRGERCAVLFGGERNGLGNDDVARANGIISVPVNPAFASLNLSQAVLLIAYEWMQAKNSVTPPMEERVVDAGDELAPREAVVRLYDHLENELDSIGYFFPPEMKAGMARSLRVALTRAGFTKSEVSTLRGVVKAFARAANR